MSLGFLKIINYESLYLGSPSIKQEDDIHQFIYTSNLWYTLMKCLLCF